MKRFFSNLAFLLIAFLLLTNCFNIEAQKCLPSGRVKGKKPPASPGICLDADCCLEGKFYNTYKCSPPVNSHTKAYLTLNSFEKGGDGNGPSKCDNQYHSDHSLVVSLSTGWFNNSSRCHHNITINANGQSVIAMVVDECDSTMGCNIEHKYQPPCANNIVVASQAVWKALHVPIEEWGGLNITWSDV